MLGQGRRINTGGTAFQYWCGQFCPSPLHFYLFLFALKAATADYSTLSLPILPTWLWPVVKSTGFIIFSCNKPLKFLNTELPMSERNFHLSAIDDGGLPPVMDGTWVELFSKLNSNAEYWKRCVNITDFLNIVALSNVENIHRRELSSWYVDMSNVNAVNSPVSVGNSIMLSLSYSPNIFFSTLTILNIDAYFLYLS